MPELLDVGDGQQIYWREYGSPFGVPALVLHGGPGSGSTPQMRFFFDATAFRIVTFDQRGCGWSTPSAAASLDHNTTDDLVADIEGLRVHLGVDRWVIYGVSWGTVLGVAYAQRFPGSVKAMVLSGVATGRPSEIDWLYGPAGIALTMPVEYAEFVHGIDGDPVLAYRDLLADPSTRVAAARRWTTWDWVTASSDGPREPTGRWADPAMQLARARICTHYFANNCFIDADAHLAGVAALGGIPATLVNGRVDLQTPLDGAVELHKRWPGSELVVVDDAGHSTADAGMFEAIYAATTKYA